MIADGFPKRPAPAYILYLQKSLPKIKEGNPDLSAPELLKKVAEAWNSASEKEKKPFENEAEKSRAEYQKAKEEYYEKHPKKLPTGYTLFYKQSYPSLRKELGETVEIKEIAKLAGQRWRNLSDNEKKKYSE